MYRRWIFGILILLLVIGVAFVVWAETPAGPMPEAILAMKSDELVKVVEKDWIVFSPVQIKPKTAFIFYPGGRVDSRSYAPIARQIATTGYQVIIVPMLLNLAFFSPSKGLDVVKSYPEIDHWVIGGHSLGGAMASLLVFQNPGVFKGLVLWASYPPESADLSDLDIEVISIYGTRDGLATKDNIGASRHLLPARTSFFPIDGGNHAQFGWYGPQNGDLMQTISRLDQQRLLVDMTVKFLETESEGR